MRFSSGYDAAGIVGVRQGTSNPQKSLPADVRKYPEAFAEALSQLRLVGVNGPYSILLSADAYTELAETSDYGYPVLEHVKRLVEDKIIWTPAIDGAFVVTTRGGDLDFHIGQDTCIRRLFEPHRLAHPSVLAGNLHLPLSHLRMLRRSRGSLQAAPILSGAAVPSKNSALGCPIAELATLSFAKDQNTP